MEWQVHGTRRVYDSEWVRLDLVTVEPPGSDPFEHHVVRAGAASGTIVVDGSGRVLLMWRHRFITDTWGYEIPAGAVDEGESPEQAARREVVEETGWSVDRVEPLVAFHPSNGLSDQTFHIFVGRDARHVGDPTDPHEASRLEWLGPDDLRTAISTGRVPDGLSLTALSYALATVTLGSGSST